MELYREFFALTRALGDAGPPYAVVGGVALAFHGESRFTRAIDVLVLPEHRDGVATVLEALGHRATAEPWTFLGAALTLHRFAKPSADDPVQRLRGSTRMEAAALRSVTVDVLSAPLLAADSYP